MINLKNKKLEVSIHVLIWLFFFLPVAFSLGFDGDWLGLLNIFGCS
jgi:hypothetical protein